MHLSTETAHSLLLASFSTRLFHLPASVIIFLSSVYNIVSNAPWTESWARVSWRNAVAFGKQMLGEPPRSVNIRHIRSEYNILQPRFQRFNTISAGMITVNNYKKKARARARVCMCGWDFTCDLMVLTSYQAENQERRYVLKYFSASCGRFFLYHLQMTKI